LPWRLELEYNPKDKRLELWLSSLKGSFQGAKDVISGYLKRTLNSQTPYNKFHLETFTSSHFSFSCDSCNLKDNKPIIPNKKEDVSIDLPEEIVFLRIDAPEKESV